MFMQQSQLLLNQKQFIETNLNYYFDFAKTDEDKQNTVEDILKGFINADANPGVIRLLTKGISKDFKKLNFEDIIPKEIEGKGLRLTTKLFTIKSYLETNTTPRLILTGEVKDAFSQYDVPVLIDKAIKREGLNYPNKKVVKGLMISYNNQYFISYDPEQKDVLKTYSYNLSQDKDKLDTVTVTYRYFDPEGQVIRKDRAKFIPSTEKNIERIVTGSNEELGVIDLQTKSIINIDDLSELEYEKATMLYREFLNKKLEKNEKIRRRNK